MTFSEALFGKVVDAIQILIWVLNIICGHNQHTSLNALDF